MLSEKFIQTLQKKYSKAATETTFSYLHLQNFNFFFSVTEQILDSPWILQEAYLNINKPIPTSQNSTVKVIGIFHKKSLINNRTM